MTVQMNIGKNSQLKNKKRKRKKKKVLFTLFNMYGESEIKESRECLIIVFIIRCNNLVCNRLLTVS